MNRRPFRPMLPLSVPVMVIGLLLAAQVLMPAACLWHERTDHATLPTHADRKAPAHHHDDESSCPTCQAIVFARIADFTLPPVFVEFLTLRPEPIRAHQTPTPAQGPRLCVHAPRGPPTTS